MGAVRTNAKLGENYTSCNVRRYDINSERENYRESDGADEIRYAELKCLGSLKRALIVSSLIFKTRLLIGCPEPDD